jgi:aromatic-amino-acid transaminase
LTSDWYWSPYKTISEELERSLETYATFDSNDQFNHEAFTQKTKELLTSQDRLTIIINTPAHNPTGYSLTVQDWEEVLRVLVEAAADKNKKIVLLVDVAYLDFAGDSLEYRAFLSKFEDLPENLLTLFAFSMSKSFTMYGMRGGALICLSKSKEIVDEFKLVNGFSNRGTWSNGNRSAMVALSRIYDDPALLRKVTHEREAALSMLQARGNTFMEASKAVDLPTCPYDSGFFVIVNCKNPDAVSEELFKDGIFTVPFNNKGLRVSIASISEAWCHILPEKMAAAIARVNG